MAKKKAAKSTRTAKRTTKKKDSITPLAPWHICDEFIDPMVRVMTQLHSVNPFENAENEKVIDDAITDVIRIRHSVHFSGARYWLEWNLGIPYADRFCERLGAFVDLVLDWAHRPKVWVTNYARAAATNNAERLQQLELEAESIKLSFQHIQSEAVETFGYLKYLSAAIRQHIELVNVNDGVRFVPTPYQLMILNQLVGRSMTQLALMTELGTGSKDTFQGAGGTGGMKELMKHGLIRNDRRKGGYYRPDSPPK